MRFRASLASAICFVLLTSACTSLKQNYPSLPALAAIDCCWLIEERIELRTETGHHIFSAALAIEKDSHTLVLLDGIGSKVFVSQRRSDGITVDADLSNGDIPARLLWTAINLVHASGDDWPESDSPWHLRIGRHTRELRYAGEPWAVAHSHPDESASIDFPRRSLVLTTRTLARSVL